MKTFNAVISAYSDLDADVERRKLWGDFWLKARLTRALRKQGVRVGSGQPACAWLHLFGHPMEPPPACRHGFSRRVIWIHSHPDLVSPGMLRGYDHVLSASEGFAGKLARMGVQADLLMLPTHMRRLRVEERHDIVFVGNARHVGRTRGRFVPRPVIRHLLAVKHRLPAETRIGIWGRGWRGIVPRDWYKAEAISPGGLNALYSSSAIVLNDHHPDMAREGFLNPRVLDALAAGTHVVSDPVAGLDPLIEGGIRIAENPAELLAAITAVLATPRRERRRQLARASAYVRRFSYTAAARRLKEIIALR